MSVLRPIVLAAALVVALWLGAAGAAEADVSSSFDLAGGRLTVAGGAEDDIAVTCRGGEVKVNGGDATGQPLGCSAVVDLLVDIDAEAAGSNRIDLSGVGSREFTRLARTVANGDRGDDTIIGTATEDTLLGGDGSDRVTGFRGDDVVFGGDGLGAGDDDGDRDGDDTLVWNDGDGSDVIDGEAGGDSVVVNGSAANGDEFAVKPDRGRVRFERMNLGRFRLDLQRAETLTMNGGGGDDRISGSAGLAGLVRLRMNGGAGDDFLIGSDGDDVMDAGPGDDTMVCGAGHDVMAGNNGEDRMVWNHGDGSDVMDGDAGRDAAEVNGAPVADDDFAVRPNGVRVRFERRNLAPFELDIATTETLRVDGGGGDDRVRTARDLGGLIAGAFYGGEGADRLVT